MYDTLYVYSLTLLWIMRYPTLCLPEILKSDLRVQSQEVVLVYRLTASV